MRARLALALAAGAFLLGTCTGGVLFNKAQPRSFLALVPCERCLRPNELAGLLTSAAIELRPGVLPNVLAETDRCVAIQHPWAQKRFHWVLFPKRDIRDIADLTAEDAPYVLDCLNVMRTLLQREHITRYRMYTNGPEWQDVRYLHLHVVP